MMPDQNFRQLCLLAVSTGLLLGEITSLKWGNIDLVRKVINVQNTKTFTTKSKRNRVVPLNE